MTEYTTGTVQSLANAGTAIVGVGTDFDGYVTDTDAYDYYFRIDDDGTGAASEWYKVASAASGTSLTLADAYLGTTISAATEAFTICTVSLLPSGLDSAIMYGVAMISAMDQGNETQAKNYAGIYQKILMQYQAIEGKKGYGKSRMKTIYEQPGVRR